MSNPAFCVWTPLRIGSSSSIVSARRKGRSLITHNGYGRWLACADVSREDVLKTARLAQLEVKEEEVEQVTDEFRKIIEFFNNMKELEVDGVEPMARPHNVENVMREDDPVRFDDAYVFLLSFLNRF